jgi:excisionase family DNA binding protein
MDYPDLPAKKLLRPDEVASFLSISMKTVRRWYQTGLLEGTELKGSLRIYRDSVLRLINAGERLQTIETADLSHRK